MIENRLTLLEDALRKYDPEGFWTGQNEGYGTGAPRIPEGSFKTGGRRCSRFRNR